MTGDDDLRAMLPGPPPPAPKSRDAAIEAALARFDGSPAPTAKPRPAAAPRWQMLQRPQAGLLAATALVVAIALPFASRTPELMTAPATVEQVAPVSGNDAPSLPPQRSSEPALRPAAGPAEQLPAAEAIVAPVSPDSLEKPGPGAPSAKAVGRVQSAPPAPPPPPPPAAPRASEAAPIVVSGQRRNELRQDAPVAVTVVSEDTARDVGGEVIVTGTRIARSKPVGRGDWNACTVNDPGRALSRCSKLAGKAAKSVRGEADAQLSEGLKQAWAGNTDDAIAAFDAAIALAPDLAVAYLNRGLAYDRQGDSEQALADLDRAVRLSPKSARTYYNRSVLLRKYGNDKRAAADEQQAINLDPRYQAILR